MPPLARIAGLIAVLLLAPAGPFGRTSLGAEEPIPPARPGLFPRLETRAERARKDAPPAPEEPSDERTSETAPPAEPPANSTADSAPKAGPAKTPSPTGDLPPLSPPKQAGQGGEKPQGLAGLSTLVNIGGSLALVLGLFFLLAWAMRRSGPGQCPALPKEAFEVLGRAPLAARQQVHLIRLGSKLVLLSVTPSGVEALSEVTDPVEVDRLAGLCQQAQPGSSTASFRQVFQQTADRGPREAGRG
jgi:flagellar biogenesis protein FliO